MRGQAFSLEAITAGILLIGGLVFALQATAVTPLSASTSSQHIENQQQATAEGVLAAGVEQGTLRTAVLNWNDTGGNFYGVPSPNRSYFVNEVPDNEFGERLDRTFSRRGIVFNVYVVYEEDGNEVRQPLIFRGEPSDNAVSASTTLTLYDDDVLYDEDQNPTDTTIDRSNFYIADKYSSTGVYQVVEVEVVVWRQ